jgi:hypothetical protein
MLRTFSLLFLQRWQALDGFPRKTIEQEISLRTRMENLI